MPRPSSGWDIGDCTIHLACFQLGFGHMTKENVEPFRSPPAGDAPEELARTSGEPMVLATNLIEATSDMGAFVLFSGVLKRIAVKLAKICNDLRLLSSGPRAGFGEIRLPPGANGARLQ